MALPSSSSSSVGNGPEPTRVAYALATPHTSSMSFGPTPAPAQALPATTLEEVTNGYVPWSMSSSVPWAPSKTTWPPLSSTSHVSRAVSVMYCSIRCP